MSVPPEKKLPPVIEFRDVAKVFNPGTPREYKALEHLNFCIEDLPGKGEFITILGPSGCGKSTALNLLAGFQEVWPPTAGEILVRGQPVTAPGVDRGMVFQKYSSFPHLTVRQNVRFGMELNRRREGLGEDEIEGRAMDWIGKVGLAPHVDKYPHQLSGGQQQRVALARALVAEPKVILFDEPLSNLDAKLREETRKELRRFLTELKITAVYVTHDQIEALALSDSIAVMRNGRIVETGTPREIYFESDRRFVADFIGHANFIAGTVAAAGESGTRVDSAIGPIACARKTGAAPGQAVTVCIRPEFIRVFTGDLRDGENVFRGKVESLVFVGDAYEGEIRVGETLLIFRISPTAAIREGEEIALQFDPRHCSILMQ